MKQDNAEQLYKQFLEELDAGAKEYDELIASGMAPAVKDAKVRPVRRNTLWYAAACFVAIATGCSYLLMQSDNDEVKKDVASTITPVEKKSVAKEMAQDNPEEKPLVAKVQVKSRVGNVSNVLPVVNADTMETMPTIELDEFVFEPSSDQIASSQDNNTDVQYMQLENVISSDLLCENCGENSIYIREIDITQ